MALFKHDELLQLHEAVIAAQLSESRDALLAGIDPHIVAGLPTCGSQSDQILRDLDALNRLQAPERGPAPFAIWLANAAARSRTQPEVRQFRSALRRCGGPDLEIEPDASAVPAAQAPRSAARTLRWLALLAAVATLIAASMGLPSSQRSTSGDSEANAIPSSSSTSSPAGHSAAMDLFDQGVRALDRGDWTAGCACFQASMDAEPAPSTLLNLASCHKRELKLAAAFDECRAAIAMNETVHDSRYEKNDRQARKLLAELEARVPKLRITVERPAPGLTVSRDGVAVPESLLGTLLRVDPGTHTVKGEAPGHRVWTQTIELKEGEVREVHLSLTKQ